MLIIDKSCKKYLVRIKKFRNRVYQEIIWYSDLHITYGGAYDRNKCFDLVKEYRRKFREAKINNAAA